MQIAKLIGHLVFEKDEAEEQVRLLAIELDKLSPDPYLTYVNYSFESVCNSCHDKSTFF